MYALIGQRAIAEFSKAKPSKQFVLVSPQNRNRQACVCKSQSSRARKLTFRTCLRVYFLTYYPLTAISIGLSFQNKNAQNYYYKSVKSEI